MKFEAKLLSPLRTKSVRFQLEILDLSHLASHDKQVQQVELLHIKL